MRNSLTNPMVTPYPNTATRPMLFLVVIGLFLLTPTTVHARINNSYINNPSFETLGAGGADVFANWTETETPSPKVTRGTTWITNGTFNAEMYTITESQTWKTNLSQTINLSNVENILVDYYILGHPNSGDTSQVSLYVNSSTSTTGARITSPALTGNLSLDVSDKIGYQQLIIEMIAGSGSASEARTIVDNVRLNYSELTISVTNNNNTKLSPFTIVIIKNGIPTYIHSNTTDYVLDGALWGVRDTNEEMYITLINISNGTYLNTTTQSVLFTETKTLPFVTDEALLTPLFYDINGQIINGTHTFTLKNNQYSTSGIASQFTIYANDGTNNLQYNNSRYWTANATCTATSTLNTYCNINNVSNAYIRFLSTTGATEYYPLCTVNNTAFIGKSRYYTVYDNTTLIECPDTAYTQAKNITLSWNASGPINNTITISEWALSLNFTANTTGNISWTLPNEAGECCSWKLQNTTYYNITSFKLLVVKSKFGDGDVVTVRYNNQLNNTLTQYYQFINNMESMQSDKVCVHNMTGIVYLDLLNEGRDFLDGATIRTEYYADSNMSNYCVAGQYVSAAERGSALPGVPVQYNYQYDYRLIITKDGYTPYITTLSGYDLENGGVIEMHMKRALSTTSDGTSIACVQYYDNTTTQIGVGVGTTYNDATLYYNTTFNAALRTVANNNGVGYALQRGIDFSQGTDVTTHVYRYNATTDEYIQLAQCNIQYLSRNFTGIPIQPPQDFIDNNNGIVSTILFVIIIILSSIVGFIFNKDGNDTGYYVFSALTVGLAFAFTWFILPAAIITLGAVGTYLMRSTEN